MSDRRVSAGPSDPVYLTGISEDTSLPYNALEYLGELKIAGAGAQAVTMPPETEIIVLAAYGDVVRWKINAPADANSFPVWAGGSQSIGPIVNMSSFTLFLANKSTAYLQFYRVVGGGAISGGGLRIGP